MEFRCENPGRRQALLEQTGNPASWINAIDYVVVHDRADMPTSLRQRVLALRCLFGNGLAALDASNFALSGGVRVVDPGVRWARRAINLASPGGPLSAPGDTELGLAERAWLAGLVASLDTPSEWVIVLVALRGDFSRYTLSLRAGLGSEVPPPGFDRRLSSVELSVKVDCPNDFDCASPPSPAVASSEPELDYLARDFSSFRRLMFDRLALLLPDEPKREPALLQTALVELLAGMADELAYFQDAVATEAHLASARLRSSVRRHARLLDYRMHEGCNARVFVHFEIAAGLSFAAGPGDPPLLPEGTRFLTAVLDTPTIVRAESVDEVLSQGPEVFELLLPVRTLSAAHDQIALHTWGDDDCCLPIGATRVALVDEGLALAAGDFLLFEEIREPDSGVEADASPARRHVVRLTHVSPTAPDGLLPVDVVEVEWASDDALPFALPISRGGQASAVARANLALIDHGRSFATAPDADLNQRPFGVEGRTRVELPDRGLSFREPLSGEARSSASVLALLRQDPRAALPVIGLTGEGESWEPVRDLLASDGSAREFVVEVENDGRVWLRFGDDVNGRRPQPDTSFPARYRLGRGMRGNVGAEAIAHLIAEPVIAAPVAAAIRSIRNPLAATGGTEPESLTDVKLHAPRAFLRQERAVTLEDWAEVAGRHPDVQRAVATIRWTGSWNTVFLSIDRIGGRPVDTGFERELHQHLERFRMAGYDLEISGPRWVPLDIALSICVDPRHLRSVVAAELAAAFGTGQLRDGSLGFFHPDNFSFGQPVYLSHVIARAARVEGVRWVDATPRVLASDNDNRFQRWGRQASGEIEAGVIAIGRVEIARCDNDRNQPDNGRIRFFVEGGA